MNRDRFQYLTPKDDVHTSDTLILSFAAQALLGTLYTWFGTGILLKKSNFGGFAGVFCF